MKLLVLILFVMALGAIWMIVREPDYTERAETPEEIAALAAIRKESVTRIELAIGEDSFILAREGDSWIAPEMWGYPADETAVNNLLKGVRSIEDAELRGESSASHPRFQVDREKGWHVQLSGDSKGLPISFTVGKGDGFERCFLRLGDADVVYSVRPNLSFSTGLTGTEIRPSSWVDRGVFKLPEGTEVEAVALTTPEGAIRLESTLEEEAPPVEEEPGPEAAPPPAAKERIWRVVEPESFAPDETVVRGLTNYLRNVTARDAVDPSQAAECGLEPPERAISFRLTDGAEVEISFGKEWQPGEGETSQGKAYYARRKGDRRVFVVASYVRDGLFKTLEQLRPSPPEPPPSPQPVEPPAQPPPDQPPQEGGEGAAPPT
ncbi:MAG: DUF4340 domain-containing protein, partial [Planctomycetota bacterium]